MVRNTLISLTPNSIERQNAKNILKYTLLLDYSIPESNQKQDFIPNVMKSCHECCRYLFNNTEQTTYSFFGTPKSPLPFPFFALNYDPLPSDLDSPINDMSLHTLILHHCIISSYHALLTELLDTKAITFYQMQNKIKSEGIYHLIKEHNIQLTDSGIRFYAPSKITDSKSSRKASDLSRISESRIKKLSYMEDLVLNNSKIKLQFSTFWHRICEISAPKFNAVSSKNFTTEQLFTKLNDLLLALEPKYNSPEEILQIGKTSIDALYHYYITERIFNLNFLFSLTDNILRVHKNTSYRLCQPDILDILCSFKKLPNVFSRQYLLKFTFDHFFADVDSYNDFWFRQDIGRKGVIMSSTRTRPATFQFLKWLEQYKLFVNYFSDFIIPIYEWCFLIMLLEKTEKLHPHLTHKEHIIKAIDSLAQYVQLHYKEIVNPIPGTAEYLNIITPFSKNNHMYTDLGLSIFNSVQSVLLSNLEDDQELNLFPFTPDYFKKDCPSCSLTDTNIALVRRFYIDLIRYSHLE